MGIQIIDPKEIARREKKRTVVMNTRKLHAWVHYYPNPGDHDERHKAVVEAHRVLGELNRQTCAVFPAMFCGGYFHELGKFRQFRFFTARLSQDRVD